MQTEAGLAVVPVPASACEGGRGAIWTASARDVVLRALAECHDRAANEIANRLLNRSHEVDEIPLRTMTDLARREGEALLA